MKSEKATFAAGCFWGVEDTFMKAPGVLETAVGYTGGHVKEVSYEEVCGGKTGHAEAVELKFDPAKVSYEELLEKFWGMHDPTTMNRQGPDVGEQYRSAVFFHSPEQESAAHAKMEELELSGKFEAPIVIEIVEAGDFYRAEEYHQKYFEKNGGGSCHVQY